MDLTQATQCVVFYDGKCGLCSSSVQWILRHDRSQTILFAPLQGKTAECLPAALRQSGALETLVVAQLSSAGPLQQFATHSDAIVIIVKAMGGPWRMLAKCLSWIPRGMRDELYRWLARRRHLLVAPQSCQLPEALDRRRFLP